MSACGFCCKPEADVKWLIAGATSYICDECVDLAADLLADIRGHPETTGPEIREAMGTRVGREGARQGATMTAAPQDPGHWPTYEVLGHLLGVPPFETGAGQPPVNGYLEFNARERLLLPTRRCSRCGLWAAPYEIPEDGAATVLFRLIFGRKDEHRWSMFVEGTWRAPEAMPACEGSFAWERRA